MASYDRQDSGGLTWADQWDYKYDDERRMAESKNRKGGVTGFKAATHTGVDKVKDAATVGVQKVKSTTTSGIRWIKDKYQKKAHQ
eukprot:c22314_g1_i2 orf=370-624(+)